MRAPRGGGVGGKTQATQGGRRSSRSVAGRGECEGAEAWGQPRRRRISEGVRRDERGSAIARCRKRRVRAERACERSGTYSSSMPSMPRKSTSLRKHGIGSFFISSNVIKKTRSGPSLWGAHETRDSGDGAGEGDGGGGGELISQTGARDDDDPPSQPLHDS